MASTISRLERTTVATVDVTDDGTVAITVTEPLTPTEARTLAENIRAAADAGATYLAEQETTR